MASGPLAFDRDETTAIVRLTRGVTNPLNGELVTELAQVIQRIKDDRDIRSLVLSSANDKFFSIGFDLPQLIGAPRADFATFFAAFNQLCLDLYTMPKPTVAALTGHAIAGGCILALCCDYRHIAVGRKLVGLNEIKLGVPIPHVADCMLRNLVGFRHAREITDTGELYLPEASLRMGLVDAALPVDQVLPASIDLAKKLGAMPEQAFALIKCNRVEAVEREIAIQREEKDRMFVDSWYAEPARQRLKEAAAKF